MKEFKIRLALVLIACMVLNTVIPAWAGEIVELEEPVVQQEITTPANADYIELDGVSDNQDTDAFKEATPVKAEYTDETFIRETVVDGIKITLTADPGVFPGEAELWAEQVEDEAAEEAIEEAVEKERDSNVNVASSYKFDIKMFVNGEEVQPDTSKGSVKVTFTLEEELSECLDANAYHLKEEADGELIAENLGAEVKTVEETVIDADESSESVKPAVFDEDGVLEDGVIEDDVTKKVTKLEAETDGFSYYVVEFTYNELQYVLSGDSSIKLSEILKTLAIEGTVSDAEVSNEELFTVTKDAEGDDWTVAALQAFSSKEWLKVTIDGQVYEIIVTDDAQPEVKYYDYVGGKMVEETIPNATVSEYTIINSDADEQDGGYKFESGKWYVVKDTVTFNKRIENIAAGDTPAHLILTDGCTFNVPAGINNESAKGLVIYGQTESSGRLLIDGVSENCAGIGGIKDQSLDSKDGGIITINGGTVEVTGGDYGAGIGGGNGASGGTITINGGTVTATGGKGGAGIGGGTEGNGGTITINDGTVEAAGGGTNNGGAGIGGGQNGAGVTITINGGTINATGGSGATGIGGGGNGAGGEITISGGTVTATGKSDSAGIGGGSGSGAGGNITISGGIVNATATGGGAGIGGGKGISSGQGCSGGIITISDGIVNATGSNSGAGIGGGEYGAGGIITISGGIVNATGPSGGAGIGGGNNGAGGTITISGGKVNASNGIKAAGIGGGLGCPGGEITISGGIVTASSRDSGAGIGGGGSNSGIGSESAGGTIIIQGGIVTAIGGKYGAAGIGGGGITSVGYGHIGGDGGTVTISGGTVTAIAGGTVEEGGSEAAGIGGGDKCSDPGTISFTKNPIVLNAGATVSDAGTVLPTDYKTNHQSYKYAFLNFYANYKVRHLKQKEIDGNIYEEVTEDTEIKYGFPGDLTEATPNNYEGYRPQQITQQTIPMDNSTVVDVKYDIIYYTITFNMNGHGTAPAPIKATPGAAIYEPVVPEEEEWSFSGWYRNKECTDKFDFNTETMPAKDITLYAKWLIVVTLDAQDGSGGTENVIVEAKYSEMPAISIPTRSGYTFGGYFESKGGAGRRYYNYDGTPAWYCDFDGPKTLYAYWISGSEPTHVHTPQFISGQAATCTADGWKDYYQCSDSGCGKHFSDAACTATISDLSEWRIGAGKVEATGHSIIHILQKDATVDAYGYKEHWYCGNCKKYYSDSACSGEIGDAAALETWKAKAQSEGGGRIEKLVPHTHTYGTATYYWSENLTQCTGYHTCTESTCQYTEFETVVTVKGATQYTATFTKSGFTVQYKDIPTPTHEHTFAEGWTSNAIAHWHAATCTHTDIVSGFAEHTWGTGESANKCTECGYEKAAPAHVHTPETIPGQAATCTADGWKDYYQCSDTECSKRFSDPACTSEIENLDTWKTGAGKVEATGHSTIHILQKDATVDAYGYKEHWYCGNCKKYYSDSACSDEIGNEAALDIWKNGDGRIDKKEPGQLYTIQWINDDGTLLKTVQLEEGKLPSYGSKPSKTGYIFTGWAPEIVLVAGDATYKATYEKKSSGGGGGSGSGGGGGSGSGGGSAGGPSKITYEDKPAVTPITVAANGAQMMGTAVASIPAAQLAKSGLAPVPGAWSKANGMWVYTKADGNKAKNEWVLITVAGGNASYFYFDSNGNMVTGWQQIGGKWMYFNNESSSLLGASLRGPGRTPDGYEIDATGAWTGR